MKGTIIRRGQKWSVVIDLGTDPISGKRVRKWHSGYERRREAEAARVSTSTRTTSRARDTPHCTPALMATPS